MKASNNCIELLKYFEGFRAEAYQDIANVWTIGFGSTMWDTGDRVKEGETITVERAEELLQWELKNKVAALAGLVVNQNQIDAILSFVYNLGVGAFNSSTLRKKIKYNPNDPTIKDEFLRWNKARVNGVKVPVKGLTIRRRKEAELYFKPIE